MLFSFLRNSGKGTVSFPTATACWCTVGTHVISDAIYLKKSYFKYVSTRSNQADHFRRICIVLHPLFFHGRFTPRRAGYLTMKRLWRPKMKTWRQGVNRPWKESGCRIIQILSLKRSAWSKLLKVQLEIKFNKEIKQSDEGVI